MVKYYLAEIVCYSGDGVLWSKLYAVIDGSPEDNIETIKKVSEWDALEDNVQQGGSMHLIVHEMKPKFLTNKK